MSKGPGLKNQIFLMRNLPSEHYLVTAICSYIKSKCFWDPQVWSNKPSVWTLNCKIYKRSMVVIQISASSVTKGSYGGFFKSCASYMNFSKSLIKLSLWSRLLSSAFKLRYGSFCNLLHESQKHFNSEGFLLTACLAIIQTKSKPKFHDAKIFELRWPIYLTGLKAKSERNKLFIFG